MAFSSLASRAVANHGKHSSRDGTPVSYLTVHHWAGTIGGDARLLNPSEQVSASYILYGSGELVGQVPEDYRPWTSGSWAADAPAVTVETQNSGNGGDWPVSDAAVEKLAQLAADLCARYGWGRLDRTRVRGHREFAQTACPGPYLWARLDAIVARGNQIIDGGTTPSKDFTMPALIRNYDTSIGLVSDAGMLDPISTMREVDSLIMTGLVGAPVQMQDGTVWNALAARTARLKAQQGQVDTRKLAAEVAALLVAPVVEALTEAGQLTQGDVEAAVAKVTKEMLAKAAA